MFALALGVIESVARLRENATVGNIQKMNSHKTRGQIERMLVSLQEEGYVTYHVEKYGRTGRKVWSLTDRCYTNMHIVTEATENAIYLTDESEA